MHGNGSKICLFIYVNPRVYLGENIRETTAAQVQNQLIAMAEHYLLASAPLLLLLTTSSSSSSSSPSSPSASPLYKLTTTTTTSTMNDDGGDDDILLLPLVSYKDFCGHLRLLE